MSFIDKLSSDFGLLSKRKFDLEDLYLNIKQCILFSKIQAVSVHESKRVSCYAGLS